MQSQTNPGTTADPSSRSTEFVPVQGGGETTSAANLLITAYVVMWALLLGFVFVSWRRQGRVETRISELEKALSASGPKDSARD
jgi:CcmD family protein